MCKLQCMWSCFARWSLVCFADCQREITIGILTVYMYAFPPWNCNFLFPELGFAKFTDK